MQVYTCVLTVVKLLESDLEIRSDGNKYQFQVEDRSVLFWLAHSPDRNESVSRARIEIIREDQGIYSSFTNGHAWQV